MHISEFRQDTTCCNLETFSPEWHRMMPFAIYLRHKPLNVSLPFPLSVFSEKFPFLIDSAFSVFLLQAYFS